MPYFTYTGRAASGEMVRGVGEGSSSGALADQLAAAGIIPLDILPSTAPQARDGSSLLEALAPRIPHEEVLLFCRQLHTLLRSGVPILRGLAGLQESTRNKAFADMLRDLRESLESGRELSTSMQRHSRVFNPFFIAMVRVGETTGQLEHVFLRMFHHLEFEREIRTQVRAALRYPLIVMVFIGAAIAIVNLFVIPQFAKVYANFNTELPLLTRILIGFSNAMVDYWWAMLAVLIGALLGVRGWLASERGRLSWDRWKLRIPIAGKIILKATLARFGRSFALSGKSGVQITLGLRTVAPTVDNKYIESKIDQMRLGVERGESVLRTATAAGVFTPVVLQMIAVGEESGALDELMDEIGRLYQREVEYELKSLGAQIEPILIVALGALVLILALGVFLPIWDLGRAALGKSGG
ncbi:MAG: type II secretion system F family protein [Proteobacteria bacterium]|nr:type II secretion system F family protein [Burkholderiales bacterium]